MKNLQRFRSVKMASTNSQSLANFDSHMRFVCPECGGEHESQAEWRRHLNTVHDYTNKTVKDLGFRSMNTRYHECLECGQAVANSQHTMALLQYHHFLHSPFSRTYRCRHCATAYCRKRALCEHLQSKHAAELRGINPVRKETKLNRNPKTNIEFYMRFICPQCGKNFALFKQWLQHLDLAHSSTSTDLKIHPIDGSRNHYCLLCKKVLGTDDRSCLMRHRFSHLPYKGYFQCSFCPATRTYKTEVLRHFIKIHRKEYDLSRQYICKPTEWAGVPNEHIAAELDSLLSDPLAIDTKGSPASNQKDWDAPFITFATTPRTSTVRKSPAQKKKNDIIAQAMRDSLIEFDNFSEGSSNLEGNTSAQFAAANTTESSTVSNENSFTTTTTSNCDYVLDESLIDLEAILRGDVINKNVPTLSQTQIEEYHDEELDDLYSVLFDEIKDGTQCKEDEEYQADDEEEEQIIRIDIEAAECLNGEDLNGNGITKPDGKLTAGWGTEVRSHIKVEPLSDSDVKLNPSPMRSKDLKARLEKYIHYICPECGCTYEMQSHWRDHVFSKHNPRDIVNDHFKLHPSEDAYLCLDCMEVQETTEFTELQRHRFKHTPYYAYLKCTVCLKRKSTMPRILAHIEYNHPEVLSTDHLKSHRQPTAAQYKCETCLQEYPDLEHLERHRGKCAKYMLNSVNSRQGRPTTVGLTDKERKTKSLRTIARNKWLLRHLVSASKRLDRVGMHVMDTMGSSRSSNIRNGHVYNS